MANPLRDLCPRAVVVWRYDAARCSVCGLAVNRSTVASAWRHFPDHLGTLIAEELIDAIGQAFTTELDRLLSPADPTHLDGKPVAEDLEAIAGTALDRFDALRRGHHLPPRSPAWPDDLITEGLAIIRPDTTDPEEN